MSARASEPSDSGFTGPARITSRPIQDAPSRRARSIAAARWGPHATIGSSGHAASAGRRDAAPGAQPAASATAAPPPARPALPPPRSTGFAFPLLHVVGEVELEPLAVGALSQIALGVPGDPVRMAVEEDEVAAF